MFIIKTMENLKGDDSNNAADTESAQGLRARK